ncbi:hypothetical protein GCM10010254_20900 [Streptomyces chromofuscus]|nr:hypothetical protein GCM10010254_20900 [Streptomyces chromofuscus]
MSPNCAIVDQRVVPWTAGMWTSAHRAAHSVDHVAGGIPSARSPVTETLHAARRRGVDVAAAAHADGVAEPKEAALVRPGGPRTSPGPPAADPPSPAASWNIQLAWWVLLTNGFREEFWA